MNEYLQSAIPWGTILAIVLGPFLAILASRYLERASSRRQRKVEIFHTLMRTRSMLMSPEHVGALNLVELEFLGEKNVTKAWKAYLENLQEPFPPIEEKEKHDKAIQNRGRLLTELLDEMAKSLNIEIQQLEILRGSYVPQGWADQEWENTIMRRSLIDVLHGKAPISVQAADPSSPYPPQPEQQH